MNEASQDTRGRAWRRRAALGAVALALAATSCARAARRPLSAPPAPPPADVERDVSLIRGLPNTRPAPIQFVDEGRFRRGLFGDGYTPPSAGKPPAFGAQAIELHDVLGEQTIAYYDSRLHSIFLRDDLRWNDDVVDVVAHEITHSLQAQNLPKLAAANDSLDAHLARDSLLEGDAMMVMLAYSSHRQRVPVRRSLARAAAMVGDVALERFLKANKGNELLLAAPPAVRARVTFPYMRGLMFVGDLWRTGGFDLVNRAYSAPPTTTEHILHPQKYLAGEVAVPVRTPVAPSGASEVISATMGELSTRMLLERCMPAADAQRAAEGWGGDAFTVFRSAAGRSAVLWATTWDTEADAEEFLAALRRLESCGESTAGALAERTGQRVVYASGVEPRADQAAELLALIEARPESRPPFGPLTIPPQRRPPATRPPFISGGAYVNEYLGLVAAVPPGGTADIGSSTSVAFRLEGAVTALAGIELSELLAVPETVDEVHGALRDIVADAIGRRALDYAGGRDVYLDALGHGIERTWYVRGTGAGLVVTVLPVCGGAGSFVFWRFFADAAGRALLDSWLASIKPTAWSVPPVCAVLDP
ncbi:MAG: hypothetical protein KF718_16135 [Polyangiaceae bacterium]|nr:hypothetical protein [Polyangiaceae bacterium]